MDHLFVNENLTRKRKQLFWQTKQKARNLTVNLFGHSTVKFLRYSLFGIAGGQKVDRNFSQIFVYKNVGNNKIQVKSVNDLNNL